MTIQGPHPLPHPRNDEGGCACTCPICVQAREGTDSLRCECYRCNQTCPSIGRLGSLDAVLAERAAGELPPIAGYYEDDDQAEAEGDRMMRPVMRVTVLDPVLNTIRIDEISAEFSNYTLDLRTGGMVGGPVVGQIKIDLVVKPAAGARFIPPEVACPFCGGHVRGHQWISTDVCSVLHPDPDSMLRM